MSTATNQAQKQETEGSLLRNQGHGLAAVEKYREASRLYKDAGNLVKAAGCQLMVAVSFKIENNLEKALPEFETALDLYRQSGDALGPGRTYRDIGIMYEYASKLPEAEQYLLQSKEALIGAPDDSNKNQFGDLPSKNAELGITLAKLGLIYIRLGKLHAAEEELMEALQLIRKAGHPFYELTALMHLAGLYFTNKHYGRMMANAEAALGIIYEHDLQTEHTRRLAQIYGLLAHGFLHHANHPAATHYAKKAFAIINVLSSDAQKPLLKDIDAAALQKQLGL